MRVSNHRAESQAVRRPSASLFGLLAFAVALVAAPSMADAWDVAVVRFWTSPTDPLRGDLVRFFFEAESTHSRSVWMYATIDGQPFPSLNRLCKPAFIVPPGRSQHFCEELWFGARSATIEYHLVALAQWWEAEDENPDNNKGTLVLTITEPTPTLRPTSTRTPRPIPPTPTLTPTFELVSTHVPRDCGGLGDFWCPVGNGRCSVGTGRCGVNSGGCRVLPGGCFGARETSISLCCSVEVFSDPYCGVSCRQADCRDILVGSLANNPCLVASAEVIDGSAVCTLRRRADCTPPPTRTPVVIRPFCPGDCDDNGAVTIDELVTAVSIALGTAVVDDCSACDTNNNGSVEVNELVQAVGLALRGCPS